MKHNKDIFNYYEYDVTGEILKYRNRLVRLSNWRNIRITSNVFIHETFYCPCITVFSNKKYFSMMYNIYGSFLIRSSKYEYCYYTDDMSRSSYNGYKNTSMSIPDYIEYDIDGLNPLNMDRHDYYENLIILLYDLLPKYRKQLEYFARITCDEHGKRIAKNNLFIHDKKMYKKYTNVLMLVFTQKFDLT